MKVIYKVVLKSYMDPDKTLYFGNLMEAVRAYETRYTAEIYRLVISEETLMEEKN